MILWIFFLAYKCHLWIDGNNGLASLAHVFRKPVACVNYMSLGHMHMTMLRKKIIICPKTYLNKSKKMNISSIFKSNVDRAFRSYELRKKNIKLQNNTSYEIKKICERLLLLINNNWKISKSDKVKQNKLRKIYSQNIKKKYNSFEKINFKSLFYFDSNKSYSWFLK